MCCNAKAGSALSFVYLEDNTTSIINVLLHSVGISKPGALSHPVPCGAMGYAQTVWSPVELRCGTLVKPSGDNSPTWDGRRSLMSPGTLAPVEVTTPTAPTGEAVASSHIDNVQCF